MSALDTDRAALRTPLYMNKNSSSSSLPSTSLGHEHITDALLRSPDNGATLDLAKKNLTDVGEFGAEELATIGREDLDDESSVLRYAGIVRTTIPLNIYEYIHYLNLGLLWEITVWQHFQWHLPFCRV